MDIEEMYERFRLKLKESFPDKRIGKLNELKSTHDHEEEHINVYVHVTEPGPTERRVIFFPTNEFLKLDEEAYDQTYQIAIKKAKELFSLPRQAAFSKELYLTTHGALFMEPSKKMDK